MANSFANFDETHIHGKAGRLKPGYYLKHGHTESMAFLHYTACSAENSQCIIAEICMSK